MLELARRDVCANKIYINIFDFIRFSNSFELSRKQYLVQAYGGEMYFVSPKTVLNFNFPQKCNLNKLISSSDTIVYQFFLNKNFIIYFFRLSYQEISIKVSAAIIFGKNLMQQFFGNGPIILNADHLNIILKSFGHFNIDTYKYLGNACILQAHRNDGLIEQFQLAEKMMNILHFLMKNMAINDIDELAKLYVHGQ